MLKLELRLPDAEFIYFPNFIDYQLANDLFDELQNTIKWTTFSIIFGGKPVRTPRCIAYFGNKHYRYSGIVHDPAPIPDSIREILNNITSTTGHNFNSVLLNYYKDGDHSIGWHSDNERSLGVNPVVASISLGIPRIFKLKHKKTREIHDLRLDSGSLLLMGENSQILYQHSLPKDLRIHKPRINLTFRQILK